jgi:hypothetical protein
MSTRREFIARSSTLAAALAVAPIGAVSRTFHFGPRQVSTAQLSFSELAAQVNTRFRVYATPSRVLELVLVEASLDPQRPQLGRRPPLDADYEKFSLIFSGPPSELLGQKILPFEHDQLGRFELLALPIFARKPDKQYYQAVFNRPRKQCRAAQPINAGLDRLKV